MSQLSHAQHGMWIAARTGAGTAYHLPVVIRLAERPDHDTLAKACHALVERHPVLGSAVAAEDGVPRLVPAVGPPALELAESVDEVVRRPFDLATGPLIRFALAGPDTLVAVAHHLVFDGASKDVLVADLAALLTDGSPAEPTPAGPTAGPTAGQVEEAGRFWAGRPHEGGPTAVPGGTLASRGTAEGEVLEFPLTVPEVEGLTHFETLVAALHALFASYGNAEVVTALDLSTRPAGLDGHIGCWVNELPLASRPAAETPFHAFATGLRADLREIYRHREVPLARAVPGLRPHAALAPVSVSYRRLSGERSPLGEVEWLAFNHAVRGALQLQVAEGADGARASLRFDPRELTDPRRFADDLARLLAAVGENPGRALGELVPFAPAVPAGTGTDATAAGTTAEGTAAGGTAAPVAAVPAADPAPDLPAAPGEDPLVGRIRAIWEEILEYAPIGPDDDIFDLGGHSLTITQIIARMEQQLGLEISLDDFFDNPTIAGVMDVIRG